MTDAVVASVNPATGAVSAQFPEASQADRAAAVRQAENAHRSWAALSIDERATALARLGDLLSARSELYASLISTEMGKPLTQARQEIAKCVDCCSYYAAHAPAILADRTTASTRGTALLSREPLGVVLGIMPWNYPFWQVIRFAVPVLISGNAIVLKHAPNVPRCALALADVVTEALAGTPALTTVLGGADVATTLISEPGIAAVSLTGSEFAGRQVAALAGQQLKKCVLELGGSDPFIVLADADVPVAARAAAAARLQNNGQSCIAAKRFLVHASVHDEFLDALLAEMRTAQLGDPFDEQTTLGPLARADLRDGLHQLVTDTRARGATVSLGGEPLDAPGFYYPATVLSGVEPGMPAFDEETFGPVAALTRANSDAELVELANRSRYGLGASVWTRDRDRGRHVVSQVEAGIIGVNSIVRSDPRYPMGGVKASGYGRELGDEGVTEFTNLRTLILDAD